MQPLKYSNTRRQSAAVVTVVVLMCIHNYSDIYVCGTCACIKTSMCHYFSLK